MKTWCWVVCWLMVWSAAGQAAVSVSPTIFDVSQVSVGMTFQINVGNDGLADVEVRPRLGWFTQDAQGQTIWQEGSEGEKATTLFAVQEEPFIVPAGETRKIDVRLQHTDFSAAYPLLFLEVGGGQVRSRLAVLFLLANDRPQQPLRITELRFQGSKAVVQIYNPAAVHQEISGEVVGFDRQGRQQASVPLPPLSVLPGCQRTLELALPEQAGIIHLSYLGEATVTAGLRAEGPGW